MRIIFFIVAFLSVFNHAAAQTVKLNVTDYYDQQAVPAVRVEWVDTTEKKTLGIFFTDDKGMANMGIPTPALVKVSALGYETEWVYIITENASVQIFKKSEGLDGVVVTGMVTGTRRRDALTPITTITSAAFRQLGATTLDQALAYQPNITVEYDPVLGAKLRMQGMGGDKVKILMDGMPLNGREAGNINLSQINLANTEKIEIVNGPMSLVYGSDALGGVINVITKSPIMKKTLSAQAQVESPGRLNAYLQGSLPFLKRHVLSAGMGRNFFSGYKYLDTGKYQRFMLFKPSIQVPAHVRYVYQAPSGFKAQLASDYIWEKIQNKGTPTISSTQAYAKDEYYYSQRSANRLLLSGKINDKLNWTSGTSYMLYRRVRQSYSKDLVNLEQIPVPDPSQHDTSVFNDYTTRGALEHNLGMIQYTVGYDINLSNATTHKIADGKASVEDYAAFLSVKTGLMNETVSLSAGARAAHNTSYHIPLLPTFQLLYKPIKQVQFRANYTKAYRAPSLKERYLEFIDPQHRILGNRALRPETGNHYQVALAWQAYEKGNNFLQFSATGFHNRVENEIRLVPTNPADSNSIDYSYANVKSMRNYIVNLETQLQYKTLFIQLGYNWGYFFFPLSEFTYDNYNYQAQISYLWRKPGLTFAGNFKYNSETPFLRGQIDGTADFDGTQPAYSMASASISKKLFKNKIQFIGGVNNLFNVRQLKVNNLSAGGGGHSGDGNLNFMPRSVFLSVNANL